VLPAGLAAAEEGSPAGTGQNGSKLVYVVPAHQTIESGLYSFLERAYEDAEKHQADYVILDLDTLGGRVDSALSIGELIANSSVPTAAFIRNKAISAGSYIALNANRIYMKPGSTIGAAAVVDGSGQEVDSAKVIAMWASEMRSAAELYGRNPEIAEGMVNKNRELTVTELNRTYGKGELVSLTSEEALKVGYANGLLQTHDEVLKALGLEGAQVEQFNPSFAEKLARLLVHPYTTTLLFVLGLAGIAIELFVPGFGIPGIVGVGSFALYFFGHFVAGFAGVEDVVLFVIGIVLLVIEVFVPGFGIWAILGIISLVSGVIMAAYDSSDMAASLGLGFAMALVVTGIVIYLLRRRGIWNKFILKDELKSELGFVSQPVMDHLLGQTGSALTTLRPAGTAVINGQRIDVVTSGEFIAQGSRITVIQVEGTRVVVREEQTEVN
jgi:membrane-bound serine protease (ClpP class)